MAKQSAAQLPKTIMERRYEATSDGQILQHNQNQTTRKIMVTFC